MGPPHMVREIEFDVSFAREAKAFAEHNNLSSFVSRRLTEVAEEVFSELSPGDEVFRIDKLEIDLGEVPAASYYEEAEKRFREKLEEALRKKLSASGMSEESVYTSLSHRITCTQSELEILMQFLESGYLPWNGGGAVAPSDDTGGGLEQLIMRVLRNAGAELVRTLRRTARPEVVARRLSRQFSPPALASLAQLLRPAQAELIAQELLRLDFFGSSGAKAEEMRERYWDFTLLRLIKHGEVRRNPAHWRDFLHSVSESAIRGFGETGQSAIAAEWDRNGARASDEAQSFETRCEIGPDDLELTELLQRALISDDPQCIARFWPAILNRPPLLVQALRQHALQAEVRRAIAAGFPDWALWEIAEMIEPEETAFIKRVALHTDEGRELSPEKQGRSSAEKTRFWEYTLTYLLNSERVSFDRGEYAEDVLGHLVGESTLARDNLILGKGMKGEVPGEPIRKLRSESFAEGAKGHLPGAIPRQAERRIGGREVEPEDLYRVPGTQEPESASLLRSFELYDVLSSRLLRAENGAEKTKDIVPIVEELAANYSWQMLRILYELREHEAECSFASILTTNELQSLAEALFGLTLKGSPQLLRRMGQRVVDPRKFYGFILDKIIREELIYQRPSAHKIAEAFAVDSSSDSAFFSSRNAGAAVIDADLQTAISPETRHERPEFSGEFVEGVKTKRRIETNEGQTEAGKTHAGVPIVDGLYRAAEAESRTDSNPSAEQVATRSEKLTTSATQSPRTQCRRPEVGGEDVERVETKKFAEAETMHTESGEPCTAVPDVDGLFRETQVESSVELDLRGEQAAAPSETLTAAALEHALTTLESMTKAELRQLIRALDLVLAQPEAALISSLKTASANDDSIRAMCELLPEGQLARLLLLLSDSPAHRGIQFADLITSACVAKGLSTASKAHHLKWQFLFQHLGGIKRHVGEASYDPDFLVPEFLTFLAARSGRTDIKPLARLIVGRLTSERFSTVRASCDEIIRILSSTTGGWEEAEIEKGNGEAAEKDAEASRAQEDSKQTAHRSFNPPPKFYPDPALARNVPPATRKAARLRHGADPDFQHIYIRNAGQVLAAPYLPRLFDRLGLLEKNAFRDEEAAMRGVHVLQYMVDEGIHPEEPLLPLNKLLCGVELESAVRRHVDLLAEERDAVDGLIQAMIAHWKVLGKTSVAGFRESFLQREGRLQLKNEAWQLLVQEKAYDMLLDRIPWGFKVIHHPWMTRTIHVEWR